MAKAFVSENWIREAQQDAEKWSAQCVSEGYQPWSISDFVNYLLDMEHVMFTNDYPPDLDEIENPKWDSPDLPL